MDERTVCRGFRGCAPQRYRHTRQRRLRAQDRAGWHDPCLLGQSDLRPVRQPTFRERVDSGYTPYATTFVYDNENRLALLNGGGNRQTAYTDDGLRSITKCRVNAGNTIFASNIYQ